MREIPVPKKLIVDGDTLEIGEDSSALIITPDEHILVVARPDSDDEVLEPVSPTVMITVAAAVISDSELYQYCFDKLFPEHQAPVLEVIEGGKGEKD